MTNLPIITAGGFTKPQRRKIFVIMHQYAYVTNNKTIHSSLQLEAFKNTVDDKYASAANGSQSILTNDGYVIPLNLRNGLAYI